MKKIIILTLALFFVLSFSTELSFSQLHSNSSQLVNESNKNVNSVKESNLNVPEPVYPDFIIMEATAYTRSAEEETQDGITKCGTMVERGTVAVDPDVIPLGTRLYVEGYGKATALDVGGVIKGNRIDLFIESKKEAFEWGRREVKVYILE